jgi:wyosine [tRNA(Phe)-imidazoG37] synthetase (radical SAM superfamily)
MIDINFYRRIHNLKKRIMNGEQLPHEYVWEQFELARSPFPVVYNIETTNACNMRCEMCPRTTMMTRPVKTMSMDVAKRIINQLSPWSGTAWKEWEIFVNDRYGISKDEMSENHFFLYVVPKTVLLHGYGDPLLDPHIPEIVRIMSERGLISYFSCNPSNIDMDRTIRTFENGLGYVKYSMESVDDIRHKAIRGSASNFTDSYQKIVKLLDLKAQRNYKTQIVITMLNLNKLNQREEYERLVEAFKDLDVYIYLKSQDQTWYEDNKIQTASIHWLEFCQFPWSSMTVKSDGLAVECVEDFNNEIILGDAKTEPLYDIWNGERYKQLRRDHFGVKRGIKCSEQCDMTLIGQLLAKG